MTDPPRLELTQQRAFELHQALTAREELIRAEGLHRLMNPTLPPFPGCPECGGPAEWTAWSVFELESLYQLHLDVDPCGHRFRADWEPILVFDGDECGGCWSEKMWP